MAPTRPVDRGKNSKKQSKKTDGQEQPPLKSSTVGQLVDESSQSLLHSYSLRSSSSQTFDAFHPIGNPNGAATPQVARVGGSNFSGEAGNKPYNNNQPSIHSTDCLEIETEGDDGGENKPFAATEPSLTNQGPSGHGGHDGTLPDGGVSAAKDSLSATGDQAREPYSDVEQEPKSYASLFQETANILKKGKLSFFAPVVSESGLKRAVIPDDLIVKQAEKWETTLVGYFIGKRPAFSFVRFHAFRLWKKIGLVEVILNDQGYFYFKFKTLLGMQSVFEGGPWLFNDIPVILTRWQPGVWFSKPMPTEVSVWVNIYDVPVALWDYDILSHIVSVIGVPIAVDRYTEEMCEKKTGRAVFARVLVELSSTQEVPMFVEAEILGTVRKFRLQYNWIPPRCSHCLIFGHKFIDCDERTKGEEEMETTLGNLHVPLGKGTSGPMDDDFQQPKRRRRRPKWAQTQSTTTIRITSDKPKIPKVTEKEKSKLDSQATDNNLTSDTSNPASVPFIDTVAPDTHPVTHDSALHYNASTSSPAAEKEMMKEKESCVGPDSSVVSPSRPSNLNPVAESCYSSSWLDYVGPSTNEEPDSENIWCYRDPTGISHGPFSLEQLHKWSGYLPSDLKIWKRSGTEMESIHLHSALKRRASGLKILNVG